MNLDQSTRRELVATTGTIVFGALLSAPATAQSQGDIPFGKFLAKDAGTVHRESLTATSKQLEGKSPVSRAGMEQLVGLLENRAAVKKNGAELLRRLEPLLVMVEEKAVQATRPESANGRYDTPSEGSRATRPKTSAKAAAASSGCRTTQTTPSAVCR